MLVTKIKGLCKKGNLAIATLEKECGLTKGSIRYWDKSPPSYDKLLKVAQYLDVPLDELCNLNPVFFSLNEKEKFIIINFRTACDFDKGRIYGYIEKVKESY